MYMCECINSGNFLFIMYQIIFCKALMEGKMSTGGRSVRCGLTGVLHTKHQKRRELIDSMAQ